MQYVLYVLNSSCAGTCGSGTGTCIDQGLLWLDRFCLIWDLKLHLQFVHPPCQLEEYFQMRCRHKQSPLFPFSAVGTRSNSSSRTKHTTLHSSSRNTRLARSRLMPSTTLPSSSSSVATTQEQQSSYIITGEGHTTGRSCWTCKFSVQVTLNIGVHCG